METAENLASVKVASLNSPARMETGRKEHQSAAVPGQGLLRQVDMNLAVGPLQGLVEKAGDCLESFAVFSTGTCVACTRALSPCAARVGSY